MKPVTTSAGEAFMVALMAGTDGDKRLLTREPLTAADLYLARDQTWCQGMRKGVLGTDLSALSMQVLPGETRGTDHLAGYFIELRDGDQVYRRQYPLTSLGNVSRRAAMRLLKQGSLNVNDTYSYYLTAVPSEESKAGEDRNGDPGANQRIPTPDGQGRFTHRIAPPVFEQAPLKDYLGNSEVLTGSSAPEEEDEEPLPIFVTQDVWNQGHEMARRGGEDESAAVWTGRLMRDTASPELFMVLDACIEAEHATEEKFAVEFSGATWARVRELLDIRRRRLNHPHERILGSVHGHNFLPEADDKGRRTCELCPTTKICTRTTAVASSADLEWHRSVFIGQPWAVLLVWGHNAREEEDWRLYGLADASLAPRTIRLLK